jgi:hypothetical protein
MRGALSPAAQGAIHNATITLEDFEQMDRRAREYMRSGQHLLASDIIFSDGLEMTEAAWRDVQRARADEEQAADARLRAIRQRQWITLAAGAAMRLDGALQQRMPPPTLRHCRQPSRTSISPGLRRYVWTWRA